MSTGKAWAETLRLLDANFYMQLSASYIARGTWHRNALELLHRTFDLDDSLSD